MKNPQITKRDVIIFFIGMITMLLLVLIYDWRSFKKGIKGEPETTSIEVLK